MKMNKAVNVPTNLELTSSSCKPGTDAGILVQFCHSACAFHLTALTGAALPSSSNLSLAQGFLQQIRNILFSLVSIQLLFKKILYNGSSFRFGLSGLK